MNKFLKFASLLTVAELLWAVPLNAQEPPAAQPEVLYGSTLWKSGKYSVRGSYRIEKAVVNEESRTVLVFGNDFQTRKGPDLKVVLSPHSLSKVTSKNALQSGKILGHLKNFSGESRFIITESVDLDKFQSLLIYCEEYAVFWGGITLQPGEVLAHGAKWQKKANSVAGTWEIVKSKSVHFLRLGADFETKSGPDLKLILSPVQARQINSEEVLKSGHILAPLKKSRGFQEYALPPELNLQDYRSLLIHCEKYTKLWGAAPLNS